MKHGNQIRKNVTMPQEVWDALDKSGEQSGTSTAHQIRKMLREYLIRDGFLDPNAPTISPQRRAHNK